VQNSILRLACDVVKRKPLLVFLKFLYVPMVCWEKEKRKVKEKQKTKENLFISMQSYFPEQNIKI